MFFILVTLYKDTGYMEIYAPIPTITRAGKIDLTETMKRSYRGCSPEIIGSTIPVPGPGFPYSNCSAGLR